MFISAVDEVSQGHLLVAGEFVPHSSAGEEVEVERRSQEVSNQLTAHGLVHGKRILKFDIERLVCILSSLCSESIHTNSLLELEGEFLDAYSINACALLTLHLQGQQVGQHLNLVLQRGQTLGLGWLLSHLR